MPKSGVSVIPLADGLARIRQRLRSRRWWCLIATRPPHVQLAGTLEERVGGGDRFEVAMCPVAGLVVAMVMVDKLHLPPAELLRIVAHHGECGVAPDQVGERDVLIPTDTPAAAWEWFLATFDRPPVAAGAGR